MAMSSSALFFDLLWDGVLNFSYSWGLEKHFGCHSSIACTLNNVRSDLAGIKVDAWPVVEATSLSTCLSVVKFKRIKFSPMNFILNPSRQTPLVQIDNLRCQVDEFQLRLLPPTTHLLKLNSPTIGLGKGMVLPTTSFPPGVHYPIFILHNPINLEQVHLLNWDWVYLSWTMVP